MPIYEYRCSADGHKLETVASLEDTITCPDCGHAMDRQFPSRFDLRMDRSSSLTDVHDKAYAEMQSNGELPPWS